MEEYKNRIPNLEKNAFLVDYCDYHGEEGWPGCHLWRLEFFEKNLNGWNDIYCKAFPVSLENDQIVIYPEQALFCSLGGWHLQEIYSSCHISALISLLTKIKEICESEN